MPRADIVSIIGGGYSARTVDLDALPGLVIGVNDAALRAPRVDVAFSMDRLWTEGRWSQLEVKKIQAHIRRSALKSVTTWPDWLHVWEGDIRSAELSADERILNGANSGFCAVNLAYTMRPRSIFLIGFDMSKGPNGEPYWYPPYPWAKPTGGTSPGRYAEWRVQFAAAKRYLDEAGIQVFNVGAPPTFDVFRRIAPHEIREFAA
jgi:hypothetical protein